MIRWQSACNFIPIIVIYFSVRRICYKTFREMSKDHSKFLSHQNSKMRNFLDSFENEKEEIIRKFAKDQIPKVDRHFTNVYSQIDVKMKKLRNHLQLVEKQSKELYSQYDDFFENERYSRLKKLREQHEDFIQELKDFDQFSSEEISDFMENLRQQIKK